MPNSNIFSVTRRNLTRYNSGMLIVFLLVLNFVIGILLFINMYHEQKVELFDFTDQEINELKLDPDGFFSNHYTDKLTNMKKGIFLVYYINAHDKLIVVDDFSTHLHHSIIKKAGDWKPEKMSMKFVKVNLPNNQPTYLLMVAKDIYIHGQRKGTIYIGKDINLLRNMYIHFLFILIGLSFVFFVLALYIGRVMTRRAMVPMEKSYFLQSEFIADASHELRTPLTVMKAGIEVLEFEEGRKLTPFSSNILNDLKEEIKNTTQLINRLLFLIRSDSRQYSLVVSVFDLRELVRQTIFSFKPLADAKEINLKILEEGPLSVCADRDMVKQLLYILVDNAVKYTPAGGNINISYGLKSTHQKKRFFIAVHDSGVGIPLKEQERIFERFYRVDKSRSRLHGSTGLGLSIAKSIVDLLDGTIEVTSSRNTGSQFTMTIPFSEKNVRQEDPT